MPVLILPRLLAVLISLFILVGAGYLLWSWYEGAWLLGADGGAYQVRDEWRLWTGLALLAWSFLGRLIVLPLLARKDVRPSRAERGDGEMVAGVGGSRLYVEVAGPIGAPPVVFTHGWGMDSTFWNYAKQDLSDRFRLTLWDLPGLGRSKPRTDRRVALSDFADDLAALLPTAGERPVLVGHSIGGMTIQTLVRDHPEHLSRIAGVVLLNTTYTNPLKTMIFSRLALALRRPVLEPLMQLVRWLQPLVWLSAWQGYLSGSAHMANRLGFGRFVTRSQLEHVTLLGTRNPPAVQAHGNLAMFDWDATGALATAGIPVLVVGGDVDIVTKLDASRTIAAENPSFALEVVEGANHLGPLERAEIYNQVIANFVLSVQRGVTRDGAGQSQSQQQGGTASPDARPSA